MSTAWIGVSFSELPSLNATDRSFLTLIVSCDAFGSGISFSFVELTRDLQRLHLHHDRHDDEEDDEEHEQDVDERRDVDVALRRRPCRRRLTSPWLLALLRVLGDREVDRLHRELAGSGTSSTG